MTEDLLLNIDPTPDNLFGMYFFYSLYQFFLLESINLSKTEPASPREAKMSFSPVTIESGSITSLPIENFVLHVCSEILKRKKWLKDPELRLKKMGRTCHSGRNNRYEFIVDYSLIIEGSEARNFQIELNIKESCDGLEGKFIAKAVTQNITTKGECFAIFNRFREIQSAHIILDPS